MKQLPDPGKKTPHRPRALSGNIFPAFLSQPLRRNEAQVMPTASRRQASRGPSRLLTWHRDPQAPERLPPASTPRAPRPGPGCCWPRAWCPGWGPSSECRHPSGEAIPHSPTLSFSLIFLIIY